MQILSPFQLAENSKSFLGPVLTNQTKFSNKINPAQIEHNTMKWVCRYFAVGVMKMDYASPRTHLLKSAKIVLIFQTTQSTGLMTQAIAGAPAPCQERIAWPAATMTISNAPYPILPHSIYNYLTKCSEESRAKL